MNAKLEPIVQKLVALIEEAYALGEADALEQVVAIAKTRSAASQAPLSYAPNATSHHAQERHDADVAQDATERRPRAPKGAVEDFVGYVLTEKPGTRPMDFHRYARDETEREIRRSSVRGHLRKGQEAGRYKEVGGRWYLVEAPKKEEAADPAGDQAASDLWPNQEAPNMPP